MNLDKTIKRYIIPEGTHYIPDETFKDFRNLEEIIIPDSVTEIGSYAFSGCTSLKKVTLPKYLRVMRTCAFTNCKSLEEVVFPSTISMQCLDKGVFSYCTNLKKINIPKSINHILDYALFNCKNLKELNMDENIRYLGIMSLSGIGIKELYIPKNILTIEMCALSNMQSLEKIIVDPQNEKYLSEDNVSLINREDSIFVQYALNSKNKKYTIDSYTQHYGEISSPQAIYGIGQLAFAGSRNLEELTLFSSNDYIGSDTFKNCNKLKKLNIKFAPYSATHLFISMPLKSYDLTNRPFDSVDIENGIEAICGSSYLNFTKLKNVSLPDTLKQIDSKVFYSAKKLEKINIPKGIQTIQPKAFAGNTLLIFDDGLEILASDLKTVQTKEDYTIISLQNGTYYVYNDSFGRIKISKEEIKMFSTNSEMLEDYPEKIIDYLFSIFSADPQHDRLIQRFYFDKKFQETLLSLFKDSDSIDKIAKENLKNYLTGIMSQKGYYNETLLNGILMLKLSSDNAKLLIDNYDETIEAFLRNCNMLNTPVSVKSRILFDDASLIIEYCNLLKKYDKKDKFLLNELFVLAFSKEEQELFIKEFDINIKRLIKDSKILDNDSTSTDNIKDLFKLSKVLGIYLGNQTLKKKASTFVSEKIFAEKLPNKLKNNYQICGDDLHRVFNLINPRDEFDIEFAMFFIENYKGLYEIESLKSGYIERIYNSFREISRTSTSDKGFQRHLKVTVEKCKNYLLTNKFNGITEEYEELALLIGEWFDNDEAFQNSIYICNEAKSAPRNIFADNYGDNINEIIENDLKEVSLNNSFTYEWLPKQSFENLLLGKYCSCCSHVNGNGAGIVRASMISPDCQNLVIRNEKGEIISKSTIYVNRKEKYAVFNTVETNLNYSKNPEYLSKIYSAFMRGASDFMKTYNKNNPNNELEIITVGQNRNTLISLMELNKSNHPAVDPFNAIDYSEYQYKEYGEYKGDSSESQRLVLTKKK